MIFNLVKIGEFYGGHNITQNKNFKYDIKWLTSTDTQSGLELNITIRIKPILNVSHL